ncbi:16S rRNA (cytosine(967)-C(5))-methyltransferase RsmB [Paenibacillus rhizophilus]|uniref:16S rRNA (cytosine(967)-C(5))-methyltransferase n=1 Tax=Paenibacillus rhizophilus TaxID=1850366 RepID=A0A3N9PER4_9BACL|nr:16S rRNA (cytosine(967)-C(5))-methyltransferase RsmB [Paenibacillus rhizophilus]RQW13817.1 16S rRNA (cytosine(967)-C(5))-methyltransferase RsmB [Paenibacillus rhizophilus]
MRPPGNRRGGNGQGGGPARSSRPATARETALDVLVRVEQEAAYSNLLLNTSLQKAGLSREDAGLATELVYGTISRLNTLDFMLDGFVSKGTNKLQPWVRCLLRMSLYQIVYLDRIPPHAAVNEAVNLAKKRGHQGISGMVNGVLRSALRAGELPALPDGLGDAERIALEHSHPLWMVKDWIRRYGQATAEDICRANNEPPSVSVRVNTTMTTRDKLLEEMLSQGLDAAPSQLSPYGIVVKGGGNLALSSWYRDGILSIQDESSMLVAEAVAPEPGMTVLDCCSAPGGKTSHMAELMKDRGTIIASDLHEHKVSLVQEQARRLGLESVEAIATDALLLAERYSPMTFDRILLDAPCSGLGVIRRKPDLKWSKTPEDVASIGALQRELLQSVSGLLKPGGVLVYSTCTMESFENEETVNDFLRRNPQFAAADRGTPLGERLGNLLSPDAAGMQILPHYFGSDGFYIAALQRLS